MAPVVALSDNPAGSGPLLAPSAKPVAAPPEALAVTVKLNGWLTKPKAVVALVIAGGAGVEVEGYNRLVGITCLGWLLLYQKRWVNAPPTP